MKPHKCPVCDGTGVVYGDQLKLKQELVEALRICFNALDDLTDNERIYDDINNRSMSKEDIEALLDEAEGEGCK